MDFGSNNRFNPFTQLYCAVPIEETVSCSQVEELPIFCLQLLEEVNNGKGILITRVFDSFPMQEILSGVPGPNEFIVDYADKTGLVRLNPSQDGKKFFCAYHGNGEIIVRLSMVSAGLGTIREVMTHLPGANAVAQMMSWGFAVCDGTTATAQGIVGAIITDPMPDLISPEIAGGMGRYLRGHSVSGILQDGAIPFHKHGEQNLSHSHTYLKRATGSGADDFNVSSTGDVGSVNNQNSDAASSGLTIGDAAQSGGDPFSVDEEVRPASMTAVPMMRVR